MEVVLRLRPAGMASVCKVHSMVCNSLLAGAGPLVAELDVVQAMLALGMWLAHCACIGLCSGSHLRS